MAKKGHERKDESKRWRVPGSGRFRLKDVDPDGTPGVKDRKHAEVELATMQARMAELQEVLYAQGRYGLLVVLQAMDTGGKDGTIRRVLGPLNPQGVRVTSFKAPSAEELSHDYLWRIHAETPRYGGIRIFNRSHYEDVLVVRVHKLVPRRDLDQRYGQINAFEQYLSENRIKIVKLFLHISPGEQKERLQARLDRPDKHWKFNSGDLAERKLWPKYMAAYETVFTRCSKPHAPWHVIPANRKWYRDWAVAKVLLHALEELDLKFPPSEPGLEKIVIA